MQVMPIVVAVRRGKYWPGCEGAVGARSVSVWGLVAAGAMAPVFFARASSSCRRRAADGRRGPLLPGRGGARPLIRPSRPTRRSMRAPP